MIDLWSHEFAVTWPAIQQVSRIFGQPDTGELFRRVSLELEQNLTFR